MDVNSVEEDEDVVIQGSALYEHLSKLGYTDFESVSLPKKTCIEKNTHLLYIDIKRYVKRFYTKLFSWYSWITQEKNISLKQLTIILNAKTLLSDHFSVIDSFVTQCNNNSKRLTLQELIMTGTILMSSTYISMCKNKILPVLITSSAICCTSYLKCIRLYANSTLTKIISLQNDLFDLCKEGLKILRRDSKIKLSFKTCLSQYSRFLEEKSKYLQPLTEILVNFMEDISFLYYQCSLSIINLLPPDSLNKESFTSFDDTSFKISGEINYQSLKKLYHTYLLVQSEMLYLLAVAYNSDTWINSCQRIPETKIVYTIRILSKTLISHKVKLSEIIAAYHASRPEPIRYKTQHGAKWQDPSIQLDLASYKLQLAYNKVFTIFKDIDDGIARESGIDNDTADLLMQRLNTAFKEIDIAKSLAEFVVLLLARSGFNNLRGDDESLTADETTNPTTDRNESDLPGPVDSDPEILDEVFEEYIKEEYVRHEETDECTLEQRKLDKLLVKSFMSELKEALVDKHKSMSARESKALQRVYKNTSQDPSSNADNANKNVVPAPPPMPSYSIWSIRNNVNCDSCSTNQVSATCKTNNSSIRENIDESDEKRPNYNTNFFTAEISELQESHAFSPEDFLPRIRSDFLVKTIPYVRRSPAFLQEETFVGSGENSEDEIVDDASDNEDNKKS